MKKYLIFIILLLSQAGCKKYLDEKPNNALALPKDNLENLKLLLYDTNTMNQQSASAGEIGSDNFYLSDSQWKTLSQAQPTSANLYIWGRDLFNDNDRNDWTLTYKVVFNTNLVLDAIKTISPTASTQTQWNSIKGAALFFRAYSFLQLLQEFAKPYDESTSAADLGIAIRLTPDITDKSTRATVKQSYAQVLQDLQEAVGLLPLTSDFKTTPNKAAANGLLARTYLLMGDYQQALVFANACLKLSPTLVDFNNLSASAAYPISRYNDEVTFHATLFQLTAYGTSYARVSDELYALYNNNDLRRTIFYKNGGIGNITFKGSYDGSRVCFGGIATDEIYLIYAECAARTGNISDAMDKLNSLLLKRWKTGTFNPITANDSSTALRSVLEERRKELVFRNLRWADLRRLNKETAFSKTLTRIVDGKNYMLTPNDAKFTFPLPNKVVQLSGMNQN
ncbi:SusD family protein [Mucilaginibacter pineti]|uniref:SusD family protein n=1 Tax=Mucilaginibacter pineti TaxID=1391627 RepID=A0A1G7H406_9SPHI|nr:RagB/SusD family nutrient uptake outer membrane protein [Mucilaginibacter pineti]SDE95043.1 SusD family protein [Mucilaginibacter pineti]